MTTALPPDLESLVAGSSHADLMALVEDMQTLLNRGKTASVMSAKMVEAGWSPEFAGWYSEAVVRNGSAFMPDGARGQGFVPYPREAENLHAAWEYKHKLQVQASLKFAGSVAVLFVAGAIGPGDGTTAMVVMNLVLIALGLLLYFNSLGDYVQSKGYPRSYCYWGFLSFLGIIALLLMTDRNDIRRRR